VNRAARIHVAEGETLVSREPDAVATAVLGSCVAACLFDRVAGTGGMNHFLLAGDDGAWAGSAERYGAYLMELLVNRLVADGARRGRLQAKLFGGARFGPGRHDIGAANADFAKRFLLAENIPVVGGSLGGASPRRIEFWPVSGRARQSRSPIETLPTAPPPVTRRDVGEVEFF